MQRFFDILFSCIALLVLLPLLAAVSLLLRMTGEGEIFFLQERIGRGGVPFKLFKFATMLQNSPNLGTGTMTVKGDPRILPAGKFLRKTKINELPQLLNILFGHMSVIGPRPLTAQTFRAYSPHTQSVVVQVRPGLSGIGSIVFRGEEDILDGASSAVEFYENIIAPYKGTLEEWYVKNQGIYTYFIAIFVTIWVVSVSRSNLTWKVFKGLPVPPIELQGALKFVA